MRIVTELDDRFIEVIEWPYGMRSKLIRDLLLDVIAWQDYLGKERMHRMVSQGKIRIAFDET